MVNGKPLLITEPGIARHLEELMECLELVGSWTEGGLEFLSGVTLGSAPEWEVDSFPLFLKLLLWRLSVWALEYAPGPPKSVLEGDSV